MYQGADVYQQNGFDADRPEFTQKVANFVGELGFRTRLEMYLHQRALREIGKVTPSWGPVRRVPRYATHNAIFRG